MRKDNDSIIRFDKGIISVELLLLQVVLLKERNNYDC